MYPQWLEFTQSLVYNAAYIYIVFIIDSIIKKVIKVFRDSSDKMGC